MRRSRLLLVALVACGGPDRAAPRNHVSVSPPAMARFAREPWLDRTYTLWNRTARFQGGQHLTPDGERVLRVAPPVYLDVIGDRTPEALVPAQIEEAETATEVGDPVFMTFIVLGVVDDRVVQLGVLADEICGPLRVAAEGDAIVVRSTVTGVPEDMCGVEREKRYYRSPRWFVNREGDEVGAPIDELLAELREDAAGHATADD